MDKEPIIYRAYGVVSNIKAPEPIIEKAKQVAEYLRDKPFMLRTGGGNTEIENVFEKSTDNKELYLPWKNFNQKDSKIFRYDQHICDIARWQQPGYETVPLWQQSFFNRTVGVVLGKDGKSPVRFIIGWSYDSVEHAIHRTAKTGFIGVAVSVAALLKIPLFNLNNTDAFDRLKLYVNGM